MKAQLNESEKISVVKEFVEQVSNQAQRMEDWSLALISGTMGLLLILVKLKQEKPLSQINLEWSFFLFSFFAFSGLALLLGYFVTDILLSTMPTLYGSTLYTDSSLNPEKINSPNLKSAVEVIQLVSRFQFLIFLLALACIVTFTLKNILKSLKTIDQTK